MGLLGTARTLVNKYRLGFGSLALTTSLLSGGTIDQSLRFDVKPTGVVRYYTREAPYDGDIIPALRSIHEHDIVGLFDRISTKNPGGLVYLEDGKLVFYTVGEHDTVSRADQQLKNQAFPYLLSAFLAGDDAQFNETLASKSIRSFLTRVGIAPHTIEHIVGLEHGNSEGRGKAREVLTALVPYNGEEFEMTLADKLRFYETHDPAGEYAGTWEALGFGEQVDMQAGFAHPGTGRYFALERHQNTVIVHAFSNDIREERVVRLGETSTANEQYTKHSR